MLDLQKKNEEPFKITIIIVHRYGQKNIVFNVDIF